MREATIAPPILLPHPEVGISETGALTGSMPPHRQGQGAVSDRLAQSKARGTRTLLLTACSHLEHLSTQPSQPLRSDCFRFSLTLVYYRGIIMYEIRKSPPKSCRMHRSKNRVRNPFRMRTYKSSRKSIKTNDSSSPPGAPMFFLNSARPATRRFITGTTTRMRSLVKRISA